MKIAATCTALSLDDKQCGYSDRDGVIGNLGVQMRMGNRRAYFYVYKYI